jgi:hypothetical protein
MTVPARQIPLLLVAQVACACASAGGDVDGDRCAEAAAHLDQCASGGGEEFLEACQQDPNEEGFAIVDEILASECDGADAARAAAGGKEDGFAEAVFVAACSPVVGAALLINRARSGEPVPMEPDTRDQLRGFFGNLVDRAQIRWDARLPDEWTILGFNVQLGFDVSAQAFGDEIFVAGSHRPSDLDQLVLLGHELAHSRQSAEFGDLAGFRREYCRAYFQSGFDYRSNRFESDARAVARDVRACLAQGAGCP